ncbi:MAG: tetratricopeptide repeat protein, partial [Candidatus Zixiibacteriota bacterium]
QERWDKAIENLSLLKDSTGQTDVEAAMMIAGVTLDGKRDHDEAIRLYDNLLARVEDTTILPAIHLRKGIAYFEKKDYNLCRNEMSLINRDFPYFFQNNPTPQKYIALSFEKIGNWNRAENEFKWLIDNYSATEAAFDAHLTIADHYKKQGNKELTDTWFSKAEEFYYAMANRYAGSNMEASAISYLAEVSRRREKWDQAAKYLENLYERFPTTEVGRKAIINAASIYREKLKNRAKADSLLNQLRSELFPPPDGKNIDAMTDDNK